MEIDANLKQGEQMTQREFMKRIEEMIYSKKYELRKVHKDLIYASFTAKNDDADRDEKVFNTLDLDHLHALRVANQLLIVDRIGPPPDFDQSLGKITTQLDRDDVELFFYPPPAPEFGKLYDLETLTLGPLKIEICEHLNELVREVKWHN